MKNINIYSNIFYIMRCNKASMNLIEYLTPNKKEKKNLFGFFFSFFITLHIYIKHVRHHVLHLLTFRIDTSLLFLQLHFPLQLIYLLSPS